MVFEKLRCWRLPLRPFLAKTSSIDQVDIESPVVVIVKERDYASLSFNDVALMIGRAPNVGNVQPTVKTANARIPIAACPQMDPIFSSTRLQKN